MLRCALGIIVNISYSNQQEINLAIDSNLHKSYYPIVIYYLLFAFFNPIDAITEASWIIFVIIPSLFKLYLSHNYSSI